MSNKEEQENYLELREIKKKINEFIGEDKPTPVQSHILMVLNFRMNHLRHIIYKHTGVLYIELQDSETVVTSPKDNKVLKDVIDGINPIRYPDNIDFGTKEQPKRD